MMPMRPSGSAKTIIECVGWLVPARLCISFQNVDPSALITMSPGCGA